MQTWLLLQTVQTRFWCTRTLITIEAVWDCEPGEENREACCFAFKFQIYETGILIAS